MSLRIAKHPKSTLVGMCYSSLPQNGVVKSSVPQSVGVSAAAANAPSAESSGMREDELDNWTSEVDGCPCSSKLGKRGSQKVLFLGNGFPESTNGDGSLPSSPDLESASCGHICESRTSVVLLEQQTHDLIRTFFDEYTGRCAAYRRQSKALSTMKRVVANVVDKHKFAYSGMIRKLSLDQQGDDMIVIRTVTQEIFSDGTTNWGRIVSLVAFGAEVCKHLKQSGREHCIEAVGHQISSYLFSEQRQWLLNNKSWDGFVEFFHVEDTESLMRNALFAIASVAGIGAGLAFLIR